MSHTAEKVTGEKKAMAKTKTVEKKQKSIETFTCLHLHNLRIN